MNAIEREAAMTERLRKFPCSRCKTPCFRIAYINNRLVCTGCFALAAAVRRIEGTP